MISHKLQTSKEGMEFLIKEIFDAGQAARNYEFKPVENSTEQESSQDQIKEEV
jgi:hypothetical protein